MMRPPAGPRTRGEGAVSEGPGHNDNYWADKRPDGGYETKEDPRFSRLKRLIEEIESGVVYIFNIFGKKELSVHMESPEEYVWKHFAFQIDITKSTLNYFRDGVRHQLRYENEGELIAEIKQLWNGPMKRRPGYVDDDVVESMNDTEAMPTRVHGFPVADEDEEERIQMGGCVETLQLLHQRVRLLEEKHFHL